MNAPGTTHKPGDRVYSAAGQAGLYVAAAAHGGHIVQPLVEDGDGVHEPVSEYADGADVWPRVYGQPPRPKLDADIAAQHQKLAALRREVSELEAQKHEAERNQSALKERLGVHQALAALDDLLSGRITHYVIDVSENRNGKWQVVPATEFFKLRTHYSVVSLQLWANLNESRSSVRWKFSPNAERHDPEGRAYAFTSEADAIAKLHEVVTAELLETCKHASHSHWLRQRVQWCQGQGVPVPDEIAQKLAAIERSELEAQAKKARDDFEKAQAALVALQPAAEQGAPA